MNKDLLIKEILHEFDRKFTKQGIPIGIVKYESKDKLDVTVGIIKSFLESSLSKAWEGGRKSKNSNVGFLRQWLNEDRITDKKLVTNEEIRYWLDIETEEDFTRG